jgi:hypothetical protein
MERSNPSRSFYLKLGFIGHYGEDNGLSLTSRQFQKKIIEYPFAWVTPENQKMALFRLTHARLILSETSNPIVDLTTMPDSPVSSVSSWKTYVYSKFPFSSPSMKRIERCVENCPILKQLTTEPLADTDRPFIPTRSLSSTSGMIRGDARSWFDDDSWLKTDDVQFLLAFLMRNKISNNGFVHVLDPSITKRAMDVYDLMPFM